MWIHADGPAPLLLIGTMGMELLGPPVISTSKNP